MCVYNSFQFIALRSFWVIFYTLVCKIGISFSRG